MQPYFITSKWIQIQHATVISTEPYPKPCMYLPLAIFPEQPKEKRLGTHLQEGNQRSKRLEAIPKPSWSSFLAFIIFSLPSLLLPSSFLSFLSRPLSPFSLFSLCKKKKNWLCNCGWEWVRVRVIKWEPCKCVLVGQCMYCEWWRVRKWVRYYFPNSILVLIHSPSRTTTLNFFFHI